MPDINHGDCAAVQTTQLTLRDLNQRNREFWEEQNALRDARISNPAILQIACREVESEASREVQVRSRRPFEQVLEDAARTKILFQADFSRRMLVSLR
jgi:hypothetical protein